MRTLNDLDLSGEDPSIDHRSFETRQEFIKYVKKRYQHAKFVIDVFGTQYFCFESSDRNKKDLLRHIYQIDIGKCNYDAFYDSAHADHVKVDDCLGETSYLYLYNCHDYIFAPILEYYDKFIDNSSSAENTFLDEQIKKLTYEKIDA